MASPALSSSDTPTRFNHYTATAKTRLSYAVWNACVGDIALRMEAVEVKATGYDSLISAGIGVALERINEALLPAFNEVSAVINQTNTYLQQLQGNSISATLITTDPAHRFVSDTQLGTIGSVADLTSRVFAVESNGSKASSRLFFLCTM